MFSPSDFLDRAFTRYGEQVLRDRMRGANGDPDTADRELYRIAKSVFGRVQAACTPSIGWPLPGVWPAGSLEDDGTTSIAGEAYADRWPDNLLQNALDLFNWRTVAGLDAASDNQRQVGKLAEAYFAAVETGSLTVGIGGDTDVSEPLPAVARNRDGSSNVSGVPDRENTLDIFSGSAWDGSWR